MPADIDFGTWLERELAARGWVPFHLAKRAGVQPSTIQNLISGERNLGADVGRAIAHALGLPEHIVFLAAGLLTEKPADLTAHPIKASIARILEKTEDDEKLRRMLRAIELFDETGGADQDQGKKAGRASRLPLAR
jgi:transcriptional regulator with XRE-family HTH domain